MIRYVFELTFVPHLGTRNLLYPHVSLAESCFFEVTDSPILIRPIRDIECLKQKAEGNYAEPQLPKPYYFTYSLVYLARESTYLLSSPFEKFNAKNA
jgi:hypothetical protein